MSQPTRGDLLTLAERVAMLRCRLPEARTGHAGFRAAEVEWLLDRLAAFEAERDRAVQQAATLVAELGEPSDRVAKLEAVAALARDVAANAGGTIRDNGLDDWDPQYAYEVEPSPRVKRLQQALAALDEIGEAS